MDTAAQDPQTTWDEVTAEREGKPSKPAAKPVPAPAEPVEIKPDPLADITAKLTEFENKISGRLRNVEGHIGNLNGTQKELRQLMEASKSAAHQVAEAPTQDAIKKAAINPAEWDALKSDFPEWAIATEKLLESRMVNNFDAKAFEANIKEQMRGETQAVRKEIIDASLEAVFPDWKDEVNSPGFIDWMNSQPETVKALSASDKVGDAAKLLKLYEVSKQSNPANQLIEQRKQTLAQATAAPKGVTRSNVQKSWEDMTATERWEYEKRSRAKRG